MKKPILCLDFDGVIHSYTSGWKGASVVPDPPVPGAMEFICKAIENFNVAIFSSRSKDKWGIEAMKLYLRIHLTEIGCDEKDVNHIMSNIDFPTEKPPAFLTIDDRAVTFTGVWPSMEEIRSFRPWNKKD